MRWEHSEKKKKKKRLAISLNPQQILGNTSTENAHSTTISSLFITPSIFFLFPLNTHFFATVFPTCILIHHSYLFALTV